MSSPLASFVDYARRLENTLTNIDFSLVESLAQALFECWESGRRVFVCGNGGSAANAIHLVNDFHYGAGMGRRPGLRAQALSANVAVLTCLANDEGYDEIFSRQLAVDGSAGDILLVFSGSGNSPNIIKALEQARAMSIRTFAIVGYSGGAAKSLADVAIHANINDMQISEDLQMIIGHMIMQWLADRSPQT